MNKKKNINKEKNESFWAKLLKYAKMNNVDVSNATNIKNWLMGGFKNLLEEALKAEFDEHMGYDKFQKSENENYRNGSAHKKIKTSFGEFKINSPRDRNASFRPKIVPKRQSDISELEMKIINMYSMGSSTRVINETLKDIYRINLDPNYISKITDKILPNIHAWKTRKLKKIYPFVFIDGMRFNVRDNGMGKDVTCYIIIGVNIEGIKEILGYWIGESESAKQWAAIFEEIKSRGVEKILIVTSDNLKGISVAISSTFPETKIQKCVIHQIRNSLRFVSSKDKKEFVNDMKKIYKSSSYQNSKNALELFEKRWINKYKYAVISWKNNFEELVKFLDFPYEIRKMIYTTNVIENINGQIRRITKTKGSFVNNLALDKLIYLKLIKIESKWVKKIHNWNEMLTKLDLMFDLSKYIEEY